MEERGTPKSSPVWLEDVPDARRFPRLGEDVSADVVVIGAGIVGTLAAWTLASRGKDVVLLERNHVATGDTGCTTAMLTRIPDVSAVKLRDRYGAEALKRVFAATGEAQRRVLALIREHGIACDLVPCSTYVCGYRPDDARLAEEWEAYKDADPHAHLVADARAETGCRSIAVAVKFEDEARFHVRKFLFGLLKSPVTGRLRVFEESGVTDVDASSPGVKVFVGVRTVRAVKLIVATGLPSPSFPELHPLLSPMVTYVVAAEAGAAMPFADHNFSDTDEPYQYYRRVDERTFILGGCDHAADASPGPDAPRKKLEAFMRERFAGEHRVTHYWSGSLFFSDDGLPYASEHPYYRGKVYVATGFGGNGMVMGSLAAFATADLADGVAVPHADLLSFARTGAKIARPKRRRKPGEAGVLARRLMQVLVPAAWLAALITPAWVFFGLRGGPGFLSGLDPRTFMLSVFPLVGLYAFTLVWAQVMLGANMPLLRSAIPWVETFHRVEGVFALLFALTHPLLLVGGLGLFEYLKIGFVATQYRIFVLLGDLQLLLIILTAGTALLMKLPWLKRRWHLIHYANYAVFAMVWTHSWFLGSDVRPTPLRYLWYFFAATVVLSLAGRVLRTRRKAPSPGTTRAFVKVAASAEVQEGRPHCIEHEGRAIALFRVGGKVYALDNVCSHAGGPLCKGVLDGAVIDCPWHHSKFDVTTGAVKDGPAVAPQPTHEVVEEGGVVKIMV